VTQLQERQLGLIYGAAFGLSSVVTDLLELVRGSDHFIEPQPVPFSLSELVRGVCDIVRPVAEEKQLELRMVLPERDARVGHPTALARILINLATNALKFTNTGWVEIGVSQLSLTRVEFSVTDTGPGIPPHVQESLYQPFRRHPLARGSRFSSAGLGLSICRRFVQALQSELTVATHEGRGTRFAFQLELPIASAL
jgi:signal transduction histidine kinase